MRYTPADLHLFVADYGNGALLPLAEALHTGAVITQSNAERLPRLHGRLLADLERRQSILSSSGVGSIAEQRTKADPREAPPYAIFAIDGWERPTDSLGPEPLNHGPDQILRTL